MEETKNIKEEIRFVPGAGIIITVFVSILFFWIPIYILLLLLF